MNPYEFDLSYWNNLANEQIYRDAQIYKFTWNALLESSRIFSVPAVSYWPTIHVFVTHMQLSVYQKAEGEELHIWVAYVTLRLISSDTSAFIIIFFNTIVDIFDNKAVIVKFSDAFENRRKVDFYSLQLGGMFPDLNTLPNLRLTEWASLIKSLILCRNLC